MIKKIKAIKFGESKFSTIEIVSAMMLIFGTTQSAWAITPEEYLDALKARRGSAPSGKVSGDAFETAAGNFVKADSENERLKKEIEAEKGVLADLRAKKAADPKKFRLTTSDIESRISTAKSRIESLESQQKAAEKVYKRTENAYFEELSRAKHKNGGDLDSFLEERMKKLEAASSESHAKFSDDSDRETLRGRRDDSRSRMEDAPRGRAFAERSRRSEDSDRDSARRPAGGKYKIGKVDDDFVEEHGPYLSKKSVADLREVAVSGSPEAKAAAKAALDLHEENKRNLKSLSAEEKIAAGKLLYKATKSALDLEHYADSAHYSTVKAKAAKTRAEVRDYLGGGSGGSGGMDVSGGGKGKGKASAARADADDSADDGRKGGGKGGAKKGRVHFEDDADLSAADEAPKKSGKGKKASADTDAAVKADTTPPKAPADKKADPKTEAPVAAKDGEKPKAEAPKLPVRELTPEEQLAKLKRDRKLIKDSIKKDGRGIEELEASAKNTEVLVAKDKTELDSWIEERNRLKIRSGSEKGSTQKDTLKEAAEYDKKISKRQKELVITEGALKDQKKFVEEARRAVEANKSILEKIRDEKYQIIGSSSDRVAKFDHLRGDLSATINVKKELSSKIKAAEDRKKIGEKVRAEFETQAKADVESLKTAENKYRELELKAARKRTEITVARNLGKKTDALEIELASIENAEIKAKKDFNRDRGLLEDKLYVADDHEGKTRTYTFKQWNEIINRENKKSKDELKELKADIAAIDYVSTKGKSSTPSSSSGLSSISGRSALSGAEVESNLKTISDHKKIIKKAISENAQRVEELKDSVEKSAGLVSKLDDELRETTSKKNAEWRKWNDEADKSSAAAVEARNNAQKLETEEKAKKKELGLYNSRLEEDKKQLAERQKALENEKTALEKKRDEKYQVMGRSSERMAPYSGMKVDEAHAKRSELNATAATAKDKRDLILQTRAEIERKIEEKKKNLGLADKEEILNKFESQASAMEAKIEAASRKTPPATADEIANMKSALAKFQEDHLFPARKDVKDAKDELDKLKIKVIDPTSKAEVEKPAKEWTADIEALTKISKREYREAKAEVKAAEFATLNTRTADDLEKLYKQVKAIEDYLKGTSPDPIRLDSGEELTRDKAWGFLNKISVSGRLIKNDDGTTIGVYSESKDKKFEATGAK